MSSAHKLEEQEQAHLDASRPVATGLFRIAGLAHPTPAELVEDESLELADDQERDALDDDEAAADYGLSTVLPPSADSSSEFGEGASLEDDSIAAQPYRDARKEAIASFERLYIEALLNRCGGNVSQGARIAGVDRVYLHRLLRKHALRSSKARPHTRQSSPPPAHQEQE